MSRPEDDHDHTWCRWRTWSTAHADGISAGVTLRRGVRQPERRSSVACTPRTTWRIRLVTSRTRLDRPALYHDQATESITRRPLRDDTDVNSRDYFDHRTDALQVDGPHHRGIAQRRRSRQTARPKVDGREVAVASGHRRTAAPAPAVRLRLGLRRRDATQPTTVGRSPTHWTERRAPTTCGVRHDSTARHANHGQSNVVQITVDLQPDRPIPTARRNPEASRDHRRPRDRMHGERAGRAPPRRDRARRRPRSPQARDGTGASRLTEPVALDGRHANGRPERRQQPRPARHRRADRRAVGVGAAPASPPRRTRSPQQRQRGRPRSRGARVHARTAAGRGRGSWLGGAPCLPLLLGLGMAGRVAVQRTRRRRGKNALHERPASTRRSSTSRRCSSCPSSSWPCSACWPLSSTSESSLMEIAAAVAPQAAWC